MPSEQENQSQNSNPNIQASQARPDGHWAGSIQERLKDGDNLMDFVAKNTPGYQASVSEAEGEIQQDVNKMAEGHNPPVMPTPAPEEVVPDVTVEEPEEEPTPPVTDDTEDGDGEASPPEGAEDDDDEEGLNLKGSTAENFKKLRTKLKETATESKKKDELLQEVTTELEKYAKGEKVPEELAKREARISELEHYEKLLNLKKSRYYQDNFVKPLEGIKERLNKVATDYNMDPKQLIQAANLQNEAELNKFLSNNLDPVGALEVKAIVKDYKNIQEQAVAAEKEPEEALNNMIESAKAARHQQQVRRLEVMQDVTRSAWREALSYIKEEGQIRELIPQEGNMEHNDRVFKPIVQAAATEYGKLVNQLAKNGLESLSKPLALALSRQCLLAHASAVAISSREHAIALAEQLENNTQRTQKHVRPSVSGKIQAGKSGSNGTGAGGGPSSPMEAATSLLKQVRGY